MENTKPVDPELEERVKEAVDMFRPQLQADGGDMEYVGIDDMMNVHLKLTGACGSCPMALMTLKMGVERYIKDAVPEVNEVVNDSAPADGADGFGEFGAW